MSYSIENKQYLPTFFRLGSSEWRITSIIDISFVLITIFLLNAGFTKQQNYIAEIETENATQASVGVTILLLNDNEVYWYDGNLKAKGQIHSTNYSDNGLRSVLNNSKIFYRNKNLRLGVTIKTNRSTSYENVINSIDELRITDIKRYSVTDMSLIEAEMIPKVCI